MDTISNSEAPLLQSSDIKDWKYLRPGDQLNVWADNHAYDRGYVDCVAQDGSVVWLMLDRAGKRTLFHKEDPVVLSFA